MYTSYEVVSILVGWHVDSLCGMASD